MAGEIACENSITVAQSGGRGLAACDLLKLKDSPYFVGPERWPLINHENIMSATKIKRLLGRDCRLTARCHATASRKQSVQGAFGSGSSPHIVTNLPHRRR